MPLIIMERKAKVFHVEDYKIMRDGIRTMLSQYGDLIEYVGEAKIADELFAALASKQIDIVILDIFLDSMQGTTTVNGLEVCTRMRVEYPHVKIIAHSAYEDADRIAKILRAGASAFVSKRSGFDELIKAIKAIADGQRYVCAETRSRLQNLNTFLSGFENTLRGKDDLFSVREREVLQLMSEGLSSKQIAQMLFITERTVETHRRNMVEKAHVKNTVELMAFAAHLGLTKK
jgi:DNA-binding NarL/FixJ family response regulator